MKLLLNFFVGVVALHSAAQTDEYLICRLMNLGATSWHGDKNILSSSSSSTDYIIFGNSRSKPLPRHVLIVHTSFSEFLTSGGTRFDFKKTPNAVPIRLTAVGVF